MARTAGGRVLVVSPATAHRWKRRWLEASAQRARSGAWARDRSSRPHRSPPRTPAQVEARVCAARERTGWGPRLIAGETGVAHSTVHAILRRHGCSRAPRAPRERVSALRVALPGRLAAHGRQALSALPAPRARVTGDRRQTSAEKHHPLGHDYFHAIVDDHSRLAYGELLADETRRRPSPRSPSAPWPGSPPTASPPGGDDRRRLELPPQPLAARTARRSAASATSSRRPTRRAGTGRSSASTRRWNANGPRACATATAPPETARCHTGCATTTSADPTAHSAANPRSAALTTSQGTTAREGGSFDRGASRSGISV